MSHEKGSIGIDRHSQLDRLVLTIRYTLKKMKDCSISFASSPKLLV